MDERRSSSRPDLDCIRDLVPPALLAAAARRARDIGVGIHRVLSVCGVLSEERYLQAFAARLGVPFESLEEISREACPLPDDGMINAVIAGALPLMVGNSFVYAVAPRALASPWMHSFLRQSPDYPRSIRITCDSRLAAFLAQHAGNAVAERAAHALGRRHPELSAASTRGGAAASIVMLSVATAMVVVLWPRVAHLVIGFILAVTFLAWSALRLWSVLLAPAFHRADRRLAEAELPHFTVVAALHDEVEVVGRLVGAIDALDYPALGSKRTKVFRDRAGRRWHSDRHGRTPSHQHPSPQARRDRTRDRRLRKEDRSGTARPGARQRDAAAVRSERRGS